MPCNIGYKTYIPVRIPQPKPQTFKKKMPAPKVDQDLLEKLGTDDPQFLGWITELNTKPLLEEALKRTLTVQSSGNISFTIDENGNVAAESSYLSSREKNEIEKTTNKVLDRWQMEVLKIVTQLLGYDANIQTQTGGGLTLVAEESGKSHPCKYIRVSKDSSGKGEITFEHFASKTELEKEKVKFVALSQKLGIKISLPKSPISGQPIPGRVIEESYHSHSHKVKG